MPNPNEMYPLQDLEEMLRHSKPQIEPLPLAFKERLRASLLEHEMSSKNSFAVRFKPPANNLIIVATAVALLLLIISLTPAGQVIADTFLRFGPFTLTNAPSAAEKSLTATPDTVYPVKTTAVGVSEIGKQAGFTVFYPRYLPDDYSSATTPTVELVYNQQGEVASIETMLFSRDEQRILYYTQIPYTPDPNRPPFDLGIGQAEATPVMVGDSEGVWLENFNWGTSIHKTPVAYNVLIWLLTTPTGEAFTFWLGSEERLPFEEMQQIAESMAPANDGPAIYLNVAFGDALTLLGFDLTDRELKLFWQANTALQTELMAFVHWRDMNNVVIAQVNRPYPTRQWLPGQTVVETYDFSQLNLPPGSYVVVVGLYYPDTAQRLSVPGHPNAEVQLTKVEIEN